MSCYSLIKSGLRFPFNLNFVIIKKYTQITDKRIQVLAIVIPVYVPPEDVISDYNQFGNLMF
jgi:hypothetical protein